MPAALASQMPFGPSSASNTSLSSSPTLLYCRLCGDSIKLGQRCKSCGSSRGQAPVSQNVASFGRTSKGKGDPWAERYMPGIAPADEEQEDKEPEQMKIKPSHDWRSSLTRNATAFNLGIGPSSISKDLKPSPTPSPLGSYASRTTSKRPDILPPADQTHSTDILPPLSPTHQHMPHSPSQPLMEHPAGGPLSKVCGTVLDPESVRSKWACSDCSVVFARDATIYVPPASAVASSPPKDTFFCKDCYTARYSLGSCAREDCQKPILGTTKEKGAFVKTSSGALYHGSCFKCQNCDRGGGKPPLGDGTEIILDLNGLPSCQDCFGAKPRMRQATGSTASKHHSASAFSPSLGAGLNGGSNGFPFPASDKSSRPDLGPKRTSYSGKKMGATIAELSQRFGALNNSATPPTTAASSTPRSPSPTRSPQPRAAHFSRSTSRDDVKDHAYKYDLGAFKSATGALARSDSRVRNALIDNASRSPSPVKQTQGEAGGDSSATREKSTSPSSANRTSRFPLPRNYQDAQKIAGQSTGDSPKASPVAKPGTDVDHTKEEGAHTDDVGDSGLMKCAVCHLGPFEGPSVEKHQEEALLVTLPVLVDGSSRPVELHADCFKCAICNGVINGEKSFVRLESTEEALSFAHPACAPPVTLSRASTPSNAQAPTSVQPSRSTRTNVHLNHPTLRTLPRPSDGGEKREYVAVHSFVRRSTSIRAKDPSSSSASQPSSRPSPMSSPITESSGRQFKSTSGAAPPTRSTLNVHRPGKVSNPAAGMFSAATTSPSSSSSSSPPSQAPSNAYRGRFGGMQTCSGCTGHLTSLESVPGPAGSVWHKKCLVCRGIPAGVTASAAPVGRFGPSSMARRQCGKQLDSFAKVRMDGEVRCASCFREGK